ncbi:MAG: cysteine hydrolase [Thermomicrobiales bacterium]|nr:cysteine hydrolase [Thermomicrobiales bacterium]
MSVPRGQPLLVVDVQLGFLNDFTNHIPGRIAALIERDRPDPMLFTRFVNLPDGPYQRFLDWHACAAPPETDLAPEIRGYACEDRIYAKPGLAGISDELRDHLKASNYERITLAGIDTDMCVLKIALDIFDLGIEPFILVDCCASTAGLQAHFAGLAVLARNIGADKLRDAGLNGGRLAAP